MFNYILRVVMSHAGQWLNTARRVLAHVRAYLESGQYGERRDNEQACLRVCQHGYSPQNWSFTSSQSICNLWLNMHSHQYNRKYFYVFRLNLTLSKI